MTDLLLPPPDQFLREDAIRGGMDLLFFAHTRHLKHADDVLAAQGLGRAHHRLMYFLARRPNIHVSALLDILAISKQSLRRVVHDLASKGLVEERQGEIDRRRRMMCLTPAGIELERAIFDCLRDNIEKAYAASGGNAVAGFWTVLQHLMGDEGRTQFRTLQN